MVNSFKWTVLVPVLNDPIARPRQSAFTQYASGYSIRTLRYRYTEWGDKGSDGAELYDHESDPKEMINLATQPQRADTVKHLSQVLRARIEDAGLAPKGLRQIRLGIGKK